MAVCPESFGHLEAIHIRQLDVQEDDLGPHRTGGSKRGFPVDRLADDVETIRLQQVPRPCTEALMVVDDEQPDRHTVNRLTPPQQGLYG